MASSVHRYLFSPPTSPTEASRNTHGSHSPLLEPQESLNALGRMFSPALGGSSNTGGGGSVSGGGSGGNDGGMNEKKYTPMMQTHTHSHTHTQLAGPGGFVSTRAYPTRSISPPSHHQYHQGHQLPPFPPTSFSSSTYHPHRSGSRSRANSVSFSAPTGTSGIQPGQPTNMPTSSSSSSSSSADYLLPPPNTHQRSLAVIRKQLNASPSIRPKTLIRLLIAFCLVGGLNILLRSYSHATMFPTLQLGGNGALVREGRKQQAVLDVEKISIVGGKKVRVMAQFGAPETLVYDDTSYEAVAPARTYRPIVSPPITGPQELLALQSYLLANPSHSLPSTTTTNRPLDPMTLVGFPPDDVRGWKELAQEVEPVVIWSTGSTWTAPVHELLDLYGIEPEPFVLDLQGRTDERQVAETLARLVPGRSAALASSSRSPPPLITIAGEPINGYAALLELHREGRLHALLERAGAVVDARSRREEADRVRRIRLEGRLAKQARVVVPVRNNVDGDDE